MISIKFSNSLKIKANKQFVNQISRYFSRIGCNDSRPRRSVLYVPGSNERALNKAKKLKTDCLLLDLEDAVGPTVKDSARDSISKILETDNFGQKEVIIRCNGTNTRWFESDIKMICNTNCNAIAIPKVENLDDIEKVNYYLNTYDKYHNKSIWCLIETPLGILNVNEICKKYDKISTIIMGTSDLTKELNIFESKDRINLLYHLQHCLTVAKSYGLNSIDGVYLNYKDIEGFKNHCEHGKMLGFDGKSLIHPTTIDICNQVFSPSQSEIEKAEKICTFYGTSENELITIDGQLIERLHYKHSINILNMSKRIEELDDSN